METMYIILLYWIIAICVTYLIRNHEEKKKRSLNSFDSHKNVGKKVNMHLQIWLFAPIFLPFFLIYIAIRGIGENRYKNRPRPLSKKLRRLLRYFVLDENRRVISIVEYNYKHGTNFTLDQVYGKGYEASLSDEDKKALKESSIKYDV